MILLLIIGFMLLLLLMFSIYGNNKSNKVVFPDYSNFNNSNTFTIEEDITLPTSLQPYEEIIYKSSVTPSVFLPRWAEPISHNIPVSFGPYHICIKENYLEIVDMNGGNNRIDLLGNITITYCDTMVLKISSNMFDVIVARGSLFITIMDKQKLLLKNEKSIIQIDKSNENTTSDLFKFDENIYNLFILPKIPNMLYLLEANKKLIIDHAEISSDGYLFWHTKGTGVLLLFVPSHLPSVSTETGIEISSNLGSFKLLRGPVWKYEIIKNRKKTILPHPPQISNIRYDVKGGRYIVLGHENESHLYIASLAEKNLIDGQITSAKQLIRYLYGDGRDPLFSSWYCADFYDRTVTIIDFWNINSPFVEKIKSVFLKL